MHLSRIIGQFVVKNRLYFNTPAMIANPWAVVGQTTTSSFFSTQQTSNSCRPDILKPRKKDIYSKLKTSKNENDSKQKVYHPLALGLTIPALVAAQDWPRLSQEWTSKVREDSAAVAAVFHFFNQQPRGHIPHRVIKELSHSWTSYIFQHRYVSCGMRRFCCLFEYIFTEYIMNIMNI